MQVMRMDCTLLHCTPVWTAPSCTVPPNIATRAVIQARLRLRLAVRVIARVSYTGIVENRIQ